MSIREDLRWVREHYEELQEKYPDRFIAVFGKRVVAFGRTYHEVSTELERELPTAEAVIEFVESGTYLSVYDA